MCSVVPKCQNAKMPKCHTRFVLLSGKMSRRSRGHCLMRGFYSIKFLMGIHIHDCPAAFCASPNPGCVQPKDPWTWRWESAALFLLLQPAL